MLVYTNGLSTVGRRVQLGTHHEDHRMTTPVINEPVFGDYCSIRFVVTPAWLMRLPLTCATTSPVVGQERIRSSKFIATVGRSEFLVDEVDFLVRLTKCRASDFRASVAQRQSEGLGIERSQVRYLLVPSGPPGPGSSQLHHLGVSQT